jgi:hypothetical protein
LLNKNKTGPAKSPVVTGQIARVPIKIGDSEYEVKDNYEETIEFR